MSDFDRDIWCLLGLPFDSVDMQHAVKSVRQSAANKSPCFLSTPNLNFLIASQSDPDFRRSVINSDLSIADGMPLIWVARILGIPFPERVAGSGLIEMLRRRESNLDRVVSVFFFGGEDGVADQACQVINKEQGGLACAGFYSPGFGSISDMSAPVVIETINQSSADFIIVALGAKKGQAWIEKNREMLSAPVISHLGAVVNFVAGNVKRAPVWMQKSGLEWVWRILQEPLLWKRYFLDGMGFTWLFFVRVLPYAVWQKLHAIRLAEVKPMVCRVDKEKEQTVIAIKGSCLHRTISPLRVVFREASSESRLIELDLSEVDVVDAAFLGLCLVLLKQVAATGGELTISGLNPDLVRIFRWNCVEYLL